MQRLANDISPSIIKAPSTEIYSKSTICNLVLMVNSHFWMKLILQKLEG